MWITENDECSEVIRKVIEYKNKFPTKCTNILPTSRYCTQNNFDLVIVGGENESKRLVVRDASIVNGTDFSNVNSLPTINYGRYRSTIVCSKGEIYVLSGINNKHKPVMHIEKYSPATNTWNVIGQMYDDRIFFCACSFIDDIYVIGGLLNAGNSSCVKFSTTNKTWTQIARMDEARRYASCVVFEGRIVVSGGYNDNDGYLNTVEAYDHIEDSWANMPNMIERRRFHKSVAIKNKLFIVGGLFSKAIEVFDLYSKKFALLQHPSINMRLELVADVSSIGNKVVIFSDREGSVFYHDVENDVWSEKSCEATKNTQHFSCASLPQ